MRLFVAAVVLVSGLYVAAHYADQAWVGVVGLVAAYFIAPGKK